jgi:hypothetical protein
VRRALLLATLLAMASPASAADAPECVAESLSAAQVTAIERTIRERSLNPQGIEAALLQLVPQAAICGQRHGWSADAAQASGEIAIYQIAMRMMAVDPAMGPERTARLESWLTAEDPLAVRRLSDSRMQGDERMAMLRRLDRALDGAMSRPMVTYIIARERLADRRERFAGL